jgi:hypothetical protein
MKMTEKETNAAIARTKKTLLEVKAKQDKLVDGSSQQKEISDLEKHIRYLYEQITKGKKS